VEELIKESSSIAQVAKKFFGYDNGHSRKKVKEYIEKNRLDISHFGHRFKIERGIKVCPVCTKSFETKLNHRDEKITCSHSCSNSYFRTGKNNPNWKDESYRTTCWEYHNKKCVVCDESNIVTVHHYDENHENNSPENLVPLCPTHHQYVHSRFRNLVIDKIDEYVYNFTKVNE
jgi:hypothetical protein